MTNPTICCKPNSNNQKLLPIRGQNPIPEHFATLNYSKQPDMHTTLSATSETVYKSMSVPSLSTDKNNNRPAESD